MNPSDELIIVRLPHIPIPPDLPTIVGINLPKTSSTDKEKTPDKTKSTQQMLTNCSTQVSQVIDIFRRRTGLSACSAVAVN